jgi:UDP-2,3-diacylglucosamine hydrolase
MLDAPCYVLSDVHLGAAPADVERTLVAFLRTLPGRARSLLINGDLFDFWFEWRSVIPRHHFRTLAALADLHDAGVELLMLAGNHDGWGGDVLTRDVGVRYEMGPWRGTLGGWRAHVEHGDGLRPVEDRKYRALRAVLRNRLAIGAFRLLHPDVGSRIARGSSHASREHRVFGDAVDGLRAVAFERLASEPETELVLFGHSHAPRLERAPGGGVYANAGSWLGEPTYLVVTPERIELRRYDGSADGERLDVVDRLAEKALPDREELLRRV